MDVIRLNRLSRQLREIALAASQGGDDLPVSVAQLAVIEAVARDPGTTVGALSATTGLAQSWVSKIVRELGEQGVFVTRKDPSDRRQTRIELDAEIRRQTFEDHGSLSVDGAVARVLPHLGPDDVREVLHLLSELERLLTTPGPTP